MAVLIILVLKDLSPSVSEVIYTARELGLEIEPSGIHP
jgi:hypothetical protein